MSYTSSFLEWLGRYVGLLVFGLLFVTTLFIRTTMMTGYFEWAEISSVPWYVYVSGGAILLLTLLWPKILKELTTKQIFVFFFRLLCEFWPTFDFSDQFCWSRRCRYCL